MFGRIQIRAGHKFWIHLATTLRTTHKHILSFNKLFQAVKLNCANNVVQHMPTKKPRPNQRAIFLHPKSLLNDCLPCTCCTPLVSLALLVTSGIAALLKLTRGAAGAAATPGLPLVPRAKAVLPRQLLLLRLSELAHAENWPCPLFSFPATADDDEFVWCCAAV